MFFKTLNSYSDIVRNIQVKRFKKEGLRCEILAVVFLKDESELHLKEYLFEDGSRKYAYHWQTAEGKAIGRWDNAPHWPEADTFPHHFHNIEKQIVEDSNIRNLESLLECLRNKLQQNN